MCGLFQNKMVCRFENELCAYQFQRTNKAFIMDAAQQECNHAGPLPTQSFLWNEIMSSTNNIIGYGSKLSKMTLLCNQYNKLAGVSPKSLASAQSIIRKQFKVIGALHNLQSSKYLEAIDSINGLIKNSKKLFTCRVCCVSGDKSNFFSFVCCKDCNRKRRNLSASKLMSKRKSIDPVYAMMLRAKCRTTAAIRQMGYTKKSRTNNLLGCEWSVLKTHIESKFKSGMNWGNRSEWHIDHIVPVSLAKTEEELKKLLHYTNLQPLWAKENLQKSNRLKK